LSFYGGHMSSLFCWEFMPQLYVSKGVKENPCSLIGRNIWLAIKLLVWLLDFSAVYYLFSYKDPFLDPRHWIKVCGLATVSTGAIQTVAQLMKPRSLSILSKNVTGMLSKNK